MRSFISISLMALVAGSAAAAGPSDVSPSIETMKEVVKEISSDAYEGRAPGTAGEEKTLSYLVRRFEAIGLKPGNKGSWFQDVPLVEIAAKNVSPLRFIGGKGPVSADYGSQMVIATYRTAAPHIEVKDSPVVFVGYGIKDARHGIDTPACRIGDDDPYRFVRIAGGRILRHRM